MMAREQTNDDHVDFVDDLKVGTQLLQGQYTIMKFINAGGFGITYLAKNSLDRDVVIKECFPGSFCRRNLTTVAARSRAHENEFAQIVKLFVQEAKSLSRLVHPNIVGVHQVFEDNNTAYMAMDYVEGRDLLAIIEKDYTALTPQKIVTMLKKLLGAVAFIHDNGMLHRDISPDNILINKDEEPILIDFGAARQQATSIGGQALSALRVVKDGYSPQEFYVSGSVQNASSDLYALAATFYHVITRSAPPNSQARLVAIAEEGDDPYTPLAGAYDGYPDGFLEAIDAAARVLPKDRIQSAKEWLQRISDTPELKIVPLSNEEKQADGKADTEAVIAQAKPADTAKHEPRAQSPASVAQDGGAKSRGGLIAAGVGLVAIIAGAAFVMRSSDQPEASEPSIAEVAESGAGQTGSGAEPEGERAEGGLELVASGATENGVSSAPQETPTQPVETVDVVSASEAAVPPEEVRLPEAGVDERSGFEAASPAAGVAEVGSAANVLVRQVASSDWVVKMPFEAVQTEDSGQFPQIVSVNELAASPENDWLQPGAIIYAVNGNFVRDQASIEREVMNAPDFGRQPLLYVPARIKVSRSEPFQEVTLAVPVSAQVELVNGIAFRVEAVDGVWNTVVESVENPSPNGLQIGDVLISEGVTGLQFENADAVETAVARLAVERQVEARFSVMRDGTEVEAAMPLAMSE